jgi:hypothetical protein
VARLTPIDVPHTVVCPLACIVISFLRAAIFSGVRFDQPTA